MNFGVYDKFNWFYWILVMLVIRDLSALLLLMIILDLFKVQVIDRTADIRKVAAAHMSVNLSGATAPVTK